MAWKAGAMDEPPGGTGGPRPRWVDDGSGAVTIAERAARWQTIVPRLSIAVLLIGGTAQDSPAFPAPWNILYAVTLLAITAALLWDVARTWRMALRFGPDGITVRNFRRIDRINWPEVRCFADGSESRGQSRLVWALAIVLHDGRVVTAAGTAGAKPAARPGTLAAIRHAAERYGIPAELTGTPARQVSHGAAPAKPVYSRSGVAALVGVLALTAVVVVIAVRSSSTSANLLALDQLQPGDCLTGSNMGLGTGSPWPESVTRVACTQPHEAEVYFAGQNWPQSLAYPGQQAIDAQSYARCVAAFASYDGTSIEVSEFTFIDISDDDSADWASGDRSLVCVAYEQYPSGPSGGAPVDYSIKGSKR